MRSGGALVIVLAGWSCSYSPQFGECTIACQSDGGCPAGLTCSGGLCGRRACQSVWVAAATGLEGASITALVVDPKRPAIVYAATEDTGVWKSTDHAATWSVSSGGLPDLPIHTLAIDPLDTDTLYCTPAFSGIYKSTDGGAMWTAINAGPTNMATADFAALAVDPAQPSFVYTAVGGALPRILRSVDGGAIWAALDAGMVAFAAAVRSFAVHPRDGTVYAATDGAGLYRIDRNGTTWASVSEPALANGAKLNAVAYDPGDPTKIYVGGDVPGVLYRSINGGTTWSPVTGPPPTVHSLAAFSSAGVTHWYVGQAGGEKGVYVSADGGSFSPTLGIAEEVTALAVDPSVARLSYAGTSRAAFKTVDGSNWTASMGHFTGYPVTALAIDPSRPMSLYVGLKTGSLRNAGLFRSTDAGATWTPPLSTAAIAPDDLIAAIAVDETRSALVWAVTLTSAWRSLDGGLSWTDSGLHALLFTVAASHSTSGRFYAGGLGSVFVSPAPDAAWSPASNGLPGRAVVNALAVDSADGMSVWAGIEGVTTSDSEGVFRTKDGGATWVSMSKTAGALDVLSVALDPAHPSTVYAGTEKRGLWTTTDGEHWNVAATALAFTGIIGVAISAARPSTIYVATLEGGVFRSIDSGRQWQDFSTGLGSRRVRRIVVDPTNADAVYVGTFDGGVFKIAR